MHARPPARRAAAKVVLTDAPLVAAADEPSLLAACFAAPRGRAAVRRLCALDAAALEPAVRDAIRARCGVSYEPRGMLMISESYDATASTLSHHVAAPSSCIVVRDPPVASSDRSARARSPATEWGAVKCERPARPRQAIASRDTDHAAG